MILMIFLLYKSGKSIIIKTEQTFIEEIDNDKIEFIGKSEKNER